MIIAGYLKTSLIEWPGKIASVIFTQGCNFRCGFCHNAELVGNADNTDIITDNADKKRITRIEEGVVLGDLEKRRKWIDAVVITGGEPTLQEDLPRFLGDLGELGFLRMVETNGSRPEVIRRLIESGLVDYWTMDIKCNFDNYQNCTNVKTEMLDVKSSMRLIANSGVEYEFRTTVVPGLHTLGNLTTLAREIHSSIYPLIHSSIQPKWYLQQFRPVNCLDRSFLKKKGFSKDEMERFLEEVKKIIPQTYLRGI